MRQEPKRTRTAQSEYLATRRSIIMNKMQQRLCELLQKTVADFRESHLPADTTMQMERLARQVEQPCEVAVVGRVKVGKSTFINALLGAEDELAKVGATETTATLNYFR
jgi:GTP-binding protein EngB required for normal cell division